MLPVMAALSAAAVAGIQDDRKAGGGSYSVVIFGGGFHMRTPAVARVVAFGPAALAPLLREMGRTDVTLDTFARCYSACDRILQKAGLKESVSWYGGLIEIEGKPPRVVRLSRNDGYSDKFRRQQVAELTARAKEVGVPLRPEPAKDK